MCQEIKRTTNTLCCAPEDKTHDKDYLSCADKNAQQNVIFAVRDIKRMTKIGTNDKRQFPRSDGIKLLFFSNN
jgi:hypothetical protein